MPKSVAVPTVRIYTPIKNVYLPVSPLTPTLQHLASTILHLLTCTESDSAPLSEKNLAMNEYTSISVLHRCEMKSSGNPGSSDHRSLSIPRWRFIVSLHERRHLRGVLAA